MTAGQETYAFQRQEFPIVAVIGNRGTGKTNFLTGLAKTYADLGFNVYCNFKLYNIDYTYITFETLAEFPDWLHDGVILLDEAQVGVDAYDVLFSRVKDITSFITQLRKRRLLFFFSTQVFTTVAKRLRLQTDYIFECKKTPVSGWIQINIYDRSEIVNDGYLRTIYANGKPFWNMYDTNQIIGVK